MSDQLVKRLRELSNAVTRADWNEFSMRIPAEKDRDADFVLLQAADKIAALEADAARYRYIRDKQNPLERINQSTLHDYGLSCYHDVGGVRELKSEGELDAAIDGAMKGGA